MKTNTAPESAEWTIQTAAGALAAGELTSAELLASCLKRADAHDAELSSLVHRTAGAERAAREADALFAKGVRLGPLQGIPVAIKDNVATADAPTEAGSRARPPIAVPLGDAAAVARLRRAGAVIVGKTSLMEFALGVPDPTDSIPVPRNPWDLDRWAGGSSSGSASGVAAGFFLGSLGSDSGGSIRLPSAFCGTTGLKPTYGLVPVDGSIPLAPGLDHLGPIARSARDCALLLSSLAALSPPTVAADDTRVARPLAGVEVLVEISQLETPGVDGGAAAAYDSAIEVLRELGARCTPYSLDVAVRLAAASHVILLTEALALHRENLRANWTLYGPHTRQRLLHAAFLDLDDVFRAHDVVRRARVEVDRLLSGRRVLVSLTAGAGSERVAQLGLNNHLAAAAVAFTRIWNPLGVPAMSVPIGFTSDGVPVGMQIVGRWFADGEVLRLADAYQQATTWHLLVPPLAADFPSPSTSKLSGS